ncbi:MAG: hydrogenase maturation protease, partial [Endomicrobia bacterium]|nr:hydrogenase maturation protease [Endomicrobiia bacterium]
MENADKLLRDFLEGAEKTVFLAIGSDLRADDAAAIVAAEELLKEKLPENFYVLKGYTAPENLTGEIKRIAPTHMIICDAADSGLKAGEVSVIRHENIKGAAFSTHSLPVNVFIDYITRDNPCKIMILGIQPANLEFGAKMTPAVKKSAIN